MALPRLGGRGDDDCGAGEVEEVGLFLRQDPDPVLCIRVGESLPGRERSADCGASTYEGVWGPGSESGAGRPGGGGGPALRLIKQV